MTDLNKPVKIKHDPETGDILSIENDCAVDDYCLHPSADEIIDPIVAVEQKWDEEDYWFEQRYADAKFAEAQKAERSRQWREEASVPSLEDFIENETEASKRTIHAYPYSQTDPMTIDEVKKESGAGVVVNGEPANYADYKPVAPKPSQVHFKPSKLKEFAKSFDEMSEAMKTAGRVSEKAIKAFKKFPATGSHENRGTNLQHRPFHNLEMIVFRDSLEENQ